VPSLVRASRRYLICAAGVVAVLVPAAAARPQASKPHFTRVARVTGASVEAGPALTGARVVWGQVDSRGAVTIRSGSGTGIRTLFSARLPAVPVDRVPGPPLVAGVAHGAASLEASPSRIAFIRYAILVTEGRCAGRPCGVRTEEPLFWELWVGASRGPFRRVAGGAPTAASPSCELVVPGPVDVSGTSIVYAEHRALCRGRLADAYAGRARVVLLRGRSKTILARTSSPIDAVAIAGRYAAWGTYARARAAEKPTITVYDLRRRSIAYRVTTGSLSSFGLQGDGTIAWLTSSDDAAATLAWASPRSPRPHVLKAVAPIGFVVRIAGDRILLAAKVPRSCCAVRLALAALNGRARTLSSFGTSEQSPRGLLGEIVDFDGRRAAFVVSTRPAEPPDAQGSTAIYFGRVR
jgi:hypothetical protein